MGTAATAAATTTSAPGTSTASSTGRTARGRTRGSAPTGGTTTSPAARKRRKSAAATCALTATSAPPRTSATMDYKGKCDDGSRTEADFGRTCRYDDMCADGEYCKALHGECSVDRDRKGFCTKIPKKDDCNKLSKKKVCTCNGKTRDNECFAEYEEENVKYGGSCN